VYNKVGTQCVAQTIMQTKVVKKTIIVGLAAAILTGVTVFSLMPPTRLPEAKGWFTEIPYVDKAIHFAFYFCLATALRLARTHFGRYDRSCQWKLLIFTALYGGAIELLQGCYFGRSADILDETANILGAATAIWLIPQRWHSVISG
jgi:VanZ family protein